MEDACKRIVQGFEKLGGAPMGLRIPKHPRGVQRLCDLWVKNMEQIRKDIVLWSKSRDLEKMLGPRYRSIVDVDAQELVAASTTTKSRGVPDAVYREGRPPLAPVASNMSAPVKSSTSKRSWDGDAEPARQNKDGFGSFTEQGLHIIDLT